METKMTDYIKKLPVNRYIDMLVFVLLLTFPLMVTPLRMEYMAKVMVYIIFALSLDLLWGYTGLMNMGHAVLFGMGGYIVGISYTLIKALPEGLPDYMTRFNLTELPELFKPLTNPIWAFALALIIPGIVAAILGWFIFSSKINGVFFSLITLALANIFELFISNQQKYTNGTNGLGGLPRRILDIKLSSVQMYYTVLIITLLAYLLCLWLTKSRFGNILQAIRENEARLTFLGFNPISFKIVVFTISGVLAGLAGALVGPVNGIISPVDVGVTLSTLVLVWVAVGGRGNMTGAIVGTVVINWLQVLLSERISDYWMLILGALVLVVVFVLPNGFIGKMIEKQYASKIKAGNEEVMKPNFLER